MTLDQRDIGLQAALASVPLPAGATPDPEGDHHLTVYQPSTDTLWEFWGFSNRADGPHARHGGRLQHVSANPGHFIDDGTTQSRTWGATATSIPLLAGLIRMSEAKALNIPHVLAVALPCQDGRYRSPAQRTDATASTCGRIPAGARFRLPASLNVDTLTLSPLGKAIAKAAQRHGLVVRDRSGSVGFYGESGPDWSTSYGGLSPRQVLAGFPWDQLQALP